MRTIKLLAAALVIASVALSPGAAFAGKKAQAGANRPATAATAVTALVPLTDYGDQHAAVDARGREARPRRLHRHE